MDRSMKMNRKSFWVGMGLAVASALSTGAIAQADDLLSRGKGDGLRIAYYNYVPYAYVNDAGDVVGEQVEIFRHITAKMGLKIQSEVATEWGNLIPGLKSDRFDVVAAAMYVTPKRCKEVSFTEPTFGIKQALIVPKGNPKELSNLESIKESGSKMVTIAGTAFVDWAKGIGIPDDKILQVPDNATAIATIDAGRADAFASETPGARQIMSALQSDDLEVLTPFGEVGGKPASPHGAYAVRKSETAFIEAFNTHLKPFIGTEPHLAIMLKHGLEKSELPVVATSVLCEK